MDGFFGIRDALRTRAPSRFVRDFHRSGRSFRSELALPRGDARVGSLQATIPSWRWRRQGLGRRRWQRGRRGRRREAQRSACKFRYAFRAPCRRPEPRCPAFVVGEGGVARRGLNLPQKVRVEAAAARSAVLTI